MCRHCVADPLGLAPFDESLTAVLRKCLELHEAKLRPLWHCDDERLVDKSVDDVLEVSGGKVLVGAHRLCSGQITAAREHGESFKGALFIDEQQLVAPVDDRT